MEKIKSYTDIEQSRKLVEILPIESADMCYPLPCEDGDKPLLEQGGFGSIPCWSLTALLDILQYPTLFQNSDKKWKCTVWIDDIKPYSISSEDTPVNACYKMILKLHELNLL